ncbi:uncharacterized protein LOC129298919 [Prosopis cineraria]|uniref:uncharacterized protein LOC129298919 n=1 Tax=Prosopis cineraria TaxID=364024 RepID=UPI00240ED56B|nr:uncharacterized protein LOC129298919 [Prosopis cineraria]
MPEPSRHILSPFIPEPSRPISSPNMQESIRRPSLSPTSENSQPSTPQGPLASSTPWGRDPTNGRTWIYPEKKTFNPAIGTVWTILPIIQAKFEHPCSSWKATPSQIKQMWFAEWVKKYKWLPQDEAAIKKNWNSKCANILRSIMHNVRQDLFQKNVRPNWIPDNVMDDLEKLWTSQDYKAKCDIAKTNRASSTRGTQHKGGSIPISEHKRRLASELGRKPTMFELFKKTHFNEKTSQFVDHRSAKVYDYYMRLTASRSSNMDSPSVASNDLDDEEEINLWLEAIGGKNKKGRIYGLRSEALDIDSTSHSYKSSSSINTQGFILILKGIA